LKEYKASSIAGGGLCKTIHVSNKLTTFVAVAYLFLLLALPGEYELAIHIQLTHSALKQHNLLCPCRICVKSLVPATPIFVT
jgi:hypothetical protein